jgi:hypothetical protein
MENLISSNTAWCLVALLVFALTTAAAVQARLGVGGQTLKRPIGLRQRGELAHSPEHFHDVHGVCHAGGTRRSMSSALMQRLPLPRNSTFVSFDLHPGAPSPAHGKEYTPC